MTTPHSNRTTISVLLLLLAGCSAADLEEPELASSTQAVSVTSVATWKNDAIAAYTVILDDAGTWPSISGFATAELNRRGLTAGLGAIVKSVQDHAATEIPALTAAAAAGQEIVNHSWTHVPNAFSGCDGIMVNACGGGLGAAGQPALRDQAAAQRLLCPQGPGRLGGLPEPAAVRGRTAAS